MKKVSFRLTALVLALALCLLPAAAGALYVKPAELTFTVGEESRQSFLCVFEGDEKYNGVFDCSGLWGNGLRAGIARNTYTIVEIEIWGTPQAADDYFGTFEIGGETLTLHIIVREKETPTPTVPTVVDNVVYNAAPEHEQALIRGVREWCNVRAGAGTDSVVIGRANLGQQISLLRWNADESWCFVEFNGLQGWIAKQFILPIK